MLKQCCFNQFIESFFKSNKLCHIFLLESVSEGHPDKVSDQISDALLDNFLAYDPSSKVACETLVTTGQVILSGEVKSNAKIDSKGIARDTINKIGYTKSEYKFSGNSCKVTYLFMSSLRYK